MTSDTGTREGPLDYQKEADKLAAADYQARMEHFRREASKRLSSYGGRPHGGPLSEETAQRPEPSLGVFLPWH